MDTPDNAVKVTFTVDKTIPGNGDALDGCKVGDVYTLQNATITEDDPQEATFEAELVKATPYDETAEPTADSEGDEGEAPGPSGTQLPGGYSGSNPAIRSMMARK